MSRPIVPCDCASPAHCLEATGGEQGLTADELELVRLRNEVAELRRERDLLRFALWGLVTELEGEVYELDRPKGGQQVPWFGALACGMRLPSVASWVRRTARDLRAVLDQGAA